MNGCRCLLKPARMTDSFPFYSEVLAANIGRLSIDLTDVERLQKAGAIVLSQAESRCISFLGYIHRCFFVFIKTCQQPWTLDNYNIVRAVLKHSTSDLDSLLIPVSDLKYAATGLPVLHSDVTENYQKHANLHCPRPMGFCTDDMSDILVMCQNIEDRVRNEQSFHLWKGTASSVSNTESLPPIQHLSASSPPPVSGKTREKRLFHREPPSWRGLRYSPYTIPFQHRILLRKYKVLPIHWRIKKRNV